MGELVEHSADICPSDGMGRELGPARERLEGGVAAVILLSKRGRAERGAAMRNYSISSGRVEEGVNF